MLTVLQKVEDDTGWGYLTQRDALGNPQGVTLTGWTAILGMAALVLLVVSVAAHAYKQWLTREIRAKKRGMVVKSRTGRSD